MSVTLQIRDETNTGQTANELTLDFLTEWITVRELIRSRVYQEVKDHNVKKAQRTFHGLIQPTGAECELNGYRLRTPRQIDWKRQYEVAQDAFEGHGFIILVDDRQAESLDDQIEITPSTKVTFLKLVPLVGG